MKPSNITTVKAKKAWCLPPKIRALTWMGIVYCKNSKDVDNINRTDEIDSTLKSHETIHVRQAESMHNSWLLFYIRYIWEWVVNIPLLTINRLAAYRFMPIEMEAYNHKRDYGYANNGEVTEWKELEKLTLKEKRELAKEYYNSRKKG
jgi:hypothetical protein